MTKKIEIEDKEVEKFIHDVVTDHYVQLGFTRSEIMEIVYTQTKSWIGDLEKFFTKYGTNLEDMLIGTILEPTSNEEEEAISIRASYDKLKHYLESVEYTQNELNKCRKVMYELGIKSKEE